MTNEQDHLLHTQETQHPGLLAGRGAVGATLTSERTELMTGRERQEAMLEGYIKWLPNTLKDTIVDPRAEWTGDISVADRIRDKEITSDDVEYAMNRAEDFYIETTPGTIVRCVDGRTGAGFIARASEIVSRFSDSLKSTASRFYKGRRSESDEPVQFESKIIRKESPGFEEIGPQILGGSLAGGVSYRHATSTDFEEFQGASIAEDARVFGERSTQPTTSDDVNIEGYLPGDHLAHPDKPGLGCGAVDGIEPIHKKINDNNITTIHGLSKGILGEKNFVPRHFTHFVSSAVQLGSQKDYFKSKEEAIEFLRETNPNALPELIGKHAEIGVLINLVPNTTFHRDLFNTTMKKERGADLQMFGVDLWYSQAMAKKLFPKSSEMQERYVHCRLAMSVAALMYLTKGDLYAGIRNRYDLAA